MRQQKRLRSSLIGISLLLCSLVIAGFTAWTYFDDNAPGHRLISQRAVDAAPTQAARSAPAPATPTQQSAPPWRPPENLNLSAKAALLIDAGQGDVLYQREADTPLPPASTVKLVTALVVTHYAEPEELVTVQAEDVVDPLKESHMGLQAGDVLTVHDLLVGMLIPSGNDASNTLARFVGGRLPGAGSPVERFVAEMNATADRLGMSGSHFVNPEGIDAPGQVTTARDLAVAGRALLADAELAPMVALPRAVVHIGGPQSRVVSLINTNELLAQEGVIGIKTGTTGEAGQCLVLAYQVPADANDDGIRPQEIVVILGSQDRYADARALLGLPSA